jgi:outer membrane lipoprotein-sorting protein
MRMRANGWTLRICAILVASRLFAPVAAADTVPGLDEIVQKSIDARGGVEKIKAIQSVQLAGKLLMGGQVEAPFTLVIKRPGLMRLTVEIQGQRLVRAFDGTTAWTATGGGEPQKLGEDETRDVQDGLDLDGPLVDYKAKGHAVELAGTEDVGGAPAYKLKLNKKSGKIEYLYLDTKTFLPVKTVTKATIQGSQTEIESYPSNYKPVNGVMSAFSLEQKAGGQSTMQMAVEKAEANVEVDDAIFRMPAAKAAQ